MALSALPCGIAADGSVEISLLIRSPAVASMLQRLSGNRGFEVILALKHASHEVKADRKVMMEAVKRYGFALQYASEELKGDRDIVMEAVKMITAHFSMHPRS